MPSKPAPVPPDDLSRRLTVARPDQDQGLPHIGLVHRNVPRRWQVRAAARYFPVNRSL